MRKSKNSHQRKPNVLPPLMNSQIFDLRPTDPLQPPDFLMRRNRLGSPPPKPNVPTDLYYNYEDNDGKPIIKMYEIKGDSQKFLKNGSRKSLKLDQMSDPLLSNRADLFTKVQHRNSCKACETDHNQYNTENLLTKYVTCTQLKKFSHDLDKKFKCTSVRPLEREGNLKEKLDPNFKTVQIPNRYEPLKPIGQGTPENN